MPIQFQCPHCGHAMQLPDNAAGKQGKCPKCSGVVTVPAPGAAPAMNPADEEFWSELGDNSPQPGQPAAPASKSDRKSDAQVLRTYVERDAEAKEISRTGLPWEDSDEGFFDRYWDTAVALMNHPGDTWGTMKLGGGFGKPLTYLLTGAVFGSFFNMLYGVIANLISLYTVTAAAAAAAAEQAEGGVEVEELPPGFTTGVIIFLVIYFFGGFFFGVVSLIVGNFIQAGFLQITMMLVGIKNTNYQTTFQVAAYTNGSIMVWSVVPVLGSLLGLGFWFAGMVYGLSSSYEVTPGKAALAVFLLFLPGIAAIVGLGMLLVGLLVVV